MKPRRYAPSEGRVQPVRFDYGALDVPGQKVLESFRSSGRKRLLGLGGVRGGKSWYGARAVLDWAIKKGGLGWILVPEYSYAAEIVRLFNDLLYQNWEVVADHREHPFPMWRLKVGKGAQVEIRSAYDPDTIRAATLSWGWMDEAARQSEYAYRNLEERVLSTRGPILLTTTPKGKNWVYKQVYSQFTKGNPEFGAALLKTVENPHLPKEEIQKLRERWASDSQYAAQELDAEFVSFEGLCYQFDEESDAIDRANVPSMTKMHPVILGMDWGSADPLAILVLGKCEQTWYVLDEFYSQRVSLDEMAQQVKSFHQTYRFRQGWMSFERPEIAQFLRDKGLPVQTTRKMDVGEGVSLIDTLIRQDKLKVVKSCVNTINEFGMYQYRTSREGEKRPGEKPLDKWNHAMDALRYAITAESPMGASQKPKIAQPVWGVR